MNSRKCWKTTKNKVNVSRKTKKNYKNGDQYNVKDSTWMYRNSIIHTSDNILIIVEKLVFIYHLTDVSRRDYLNNMETLQCSRTTKQGKESNNICHQKSVKVRVRCQNIAKYITEILNTKKQTN